MELFGDLSSDEADTVFDTIDADMAKLEGQRADLLDELDGATGMNLLPSTAHHVHKAPLPFTASYGK